MVSTLHTKSQNVADVLFAASKSLLLLEGGRTSKHTIIALSVMCFLALVPALSYTTHVPLYSDCIDVFTVLHVCLFQSNISTATRGCAELGNEHFDLGVW